MEILSAYRVDWLAGENTDKHKPADLPDLPDTWPFAVPTTDKEIENAIASSMSKKTTIKCRAPVRFNEQARGTVVTPIETGPFSQRTSVLAAKIYPRSMV